MQMYRDVLSLSHFVYRVYTYSTFFNIKQIQITLLMPFMSLKWIRICSDFSTVSFSTKTHDFNVNIITLHIILHGIIHSPLFKEYIWFTSSGFSFTSIWFRNLQSTTCVANSQYGKTIYVSHAWVKEKWSMTHAIYQYSRSECKDTAKIYIKWPGVPFRNINQLIPAWISNYIHYEVWEEWHPFTDFNGATGEVWERISNFLHFSGNVVTHPCP